MPFNRIQAHMVELEDGTKVSDIAKSPRSYSWTATEGQTVFNLPEGMSYLVGKKVLQVFVGGSLQSNITENSATQFTLGGGAPGGVIVEARWTEAYQPVVAGTSVKELVDYESEIYDKFGILSDSVDEHAETLGSLLEKLNDLTGDIDAGLFTEGETDTVIDGGAF